MHTSHCFAIRPGRIRYLGACVDGATCNDLLGKDERLFISEEVHARTARRHALEEASHLIEDANLTWQKASMLRKLRTARRLTVPELALASGVGYRQIYNLENGTDFNPTVQTLHRLALALDTHYAILI